jgi:Flp pilus assembly pilin Flp
MKKPILALGLIAAAVLTTLTTGCDQIKDALFVAFNANAAAVEFTIPIISDNQG